MPDSKTIGRRIKKLRESKNMSQEILANVINVSPSTISMYETGERIPRDETKIKIAKVFNVSVSSIFFE